jgi:hypothetical protein
VAIYHFHVGIVSRKTGRSAVGASAYRSAEKLKSDYDSLTHEYGKTSSVNTSAYNSGEKLHNNQKSMTHDYTRKRGVVHKEIMLPDNAPREYADRGTLWNAVEKSEKRKDAQTARDIDVALPIELDRQEQIELMREYIKENFVDRGMCADFAIHDKQDGNPHAHILLTTREVSECGFGKKKREWNSKNYLQEWRENWANACNKRLKNIEHHIDHRTLKAQSIDREPTIHIGMQSWHLEKRGIRTERGDRNRAIIARNESRKPERIAEHMHELREQHFLLDNEITKLQEVSSVAGQEMNRARARAEDLTERAEYIETLKSQLEELQAERQSMNIFKSKKAIDEQIQQQEKDYIYATEYFEYAYKIKPEHAGEEIERLEEFAYSQKHLQDILDSVSEQNLQKIMQKLNPEQRKALDDLREVERLHGREIIRYR